MLVHRQIIFGVCCVSLVAGAVVSGPRAAVGDAPAAQRAGAPLVVHVISGSGEYKSEPSLKEWKEHLEKNFNVTCTASWAKDGAASLENIGAIPAAELLIVFARRMKLPEEQMAVIRKHWESGKPIVGIRTSSHAFGAADNEVFDKQVMGGHYKGHYGGEPVMVAVAEDAASHPVLAGFVPFTSRKLYSTGPLASGTKVLLVGDIGKAKHPVAWVHEYRGGRMFYTSLGVPEDFQDKNFRRLLLSAMFWTTGRDEARMKK
jgi:type 1 glutamine amidotransferase